MGKQPIRYRCKGINGLDTPERLNIDNIKRKLRDLK